MPGARGGCWGEKRRTASRWRLDPPRLTTTHLTLPGGYDALARLTDLWINAHELSLGLTSSRVFLD